MNVSSKKPKPFCQVVDCPRKSIVTVHFVRTGSVIRFCDKHSKQAFVKIKPGEA